MNIRSRIRRMPLAAAGALCALTAGFAHASFDNPLITPQAAGMGGASLAAVGDSAALFLNPAAAAGLERPEAYFMYNQLYTGLKGVGGIGQGFASFGVPTKIGSFSAGYGEFQAAGLVDERVVGVSFARSVFGTIDAGVTGKYLTHSYLIGSDPGAALDPVFAHGTARGAFALDAGAIAALTRSLKAGLAVRNVSEPNVGLATPDRVPREVQAGLAYGFTRWDLRLTADYNYRDVPSGTFWDRAVPAVGLEKTFVDDMIRFRAGATPDQFSGGIGVRYGALDFDYAFILSRNLIANNAGSQQAGFRYRFGGPSQGEKERAAESAARSTPLPEAPTKPAMAFPLPPNPAGGE